MRGRWLENRVTQLVDKSLERTNSPQCEVEDKSISNIVSHVNPVEALGNHTNAVRVLDFLKTLVIMDIILPKLPEELKLTLFV